MANMRIVLDGDLFALLDKVEAAAQAKGMLVGKRWEALYRNGTQTIALRAYERFFYRIYGACQLTLHMTCEASQTTLLAIAQPSKAACGFGAPAKFMEDFVAQLREAGLCILRCEKCKKSEL